MMAAPVHALVALLLAVSVTVAAVATADGALAADGGPALDSIAFTGGGEGAAHGTLRTAGGVRVRVRCVGRQCHAHNFPSSVRCVLAAPPQPQLTRGAAASGDGDGEAAAGTVAGSSAVAGGTALWRCELTPPQNWTRAVAYRSVAVACGGGAGAAGLATATVGGDIADARASRGDSDGDGGAAARFLPTRRRGVGAATAAFGGPPDAVAEVRSSGGAPVVVLAGDSDAEADGSPSPGCEVTFAVSESFDWKELAALIGLLFFTVFFAVTMLCCVGSRRYVLDVSKARMRRSLEDVERDRAEHWNRMRFAEQQNQPARERSLEQHRVELHAALKGPGEAALRGGRKDWSKVPLEQMTYPIDGVARG